MSGLVAGAGLAAAAAVGLLTPVGRVAVRSGSDLAAADARRPFPPGAGSAGHLLGRAWPLVPALLLWLCGAGTVAALVVLAVTSSVLAGRRRAASVRRDAEREARAVEACVVLTDELRAGRVPGEALAAASEADPVLAPVRRVADAGGDVPAALRATGVRAYVVLAAAWQVAHQHGAGLAQALHRVLAHLRADRATARVVASELASARSTAKLLVALPGFALLAGAASGGRPWEFLLGTPAGVGCLAVGLTLAFAGLRWIDAIAAGVTGRPGPLPRTRPGERS